MHNFYYSNLNNELSINFYHASELLYEIVS